MLIEDLIGKSSNLGTRELLTIKTQCAQFLKESAGLPVYKALPKTHHDFCRVKVRMQKKNDNVAEVFNKAFGSQFYNLRQRAIFAYASLTESSSVDVEPFYVFPTNGYSYLYSKEVKNSSSDYKQVIDTLFEQFENNNKAIEIVTDILKYTYARENLVEGIISDSEIIFYGIPQYYAIRVSVAESYGKLLSSMKK